MNIAYLALPVLGLLVCCVLFTVGENGLFLNEFAVEIPGGKERALRVAGEHGYKLIEEGPVPDVYLLRHSDVPHRSKREAEGHAGRLREDGRVRYVAQQRSLGRAKRGLSVQERNDRDEREEARAIVKSDGHLNDPQMDKEWYISMQDETSDLGVKECWRKGLTGKGIKITILDDGIERSHPDLIQNYDANCSIDLNDKDDDPSPRYDPTNENKHGTRCAGEIAMVANNGLCGTGIAFDCKIGGVRMLDGHVTDHLEGSAIAFNHKYVDIYSASWGPNDDGKTTEAPGPVASKAFELGIKEGRGGLGALYVWASGNGGRIGDNCNSDGYTSSIYSMSISSATQHGNAPWYGEKCSSTLATTYSSGSSREGKVTSADLHHKCTNDHSGTSAAAPMAAGLYALLLEANPNLTWRDVQHITAYSARMASLANATGWYKNGAGFCVNLAFGHGLMDAAAMAKMADPQTWENVPEQVKCTVKVDKTEFPRNLSTGGQVSVEVTTDACQGHANEVNFLEHLQVVLDLDYSRRGNIYVEVVSPMGTVTSLMQERRLDRSDQGFQQWALMSTHQWGENPRGRWKVTVADGTSNADSGALKGLELVMYGTKEQPKYMKDHGPKDCAALKSKSVAPTSAPSQDKELQAYDALTNLVHGNALTNFLHGLQQHVQPKPAETTPKDTLKNALSNLLNKLRSY